jgi:hypothetical protein
VLTVSRTPSISTQEEFFAVDKGMSCQFGGLNEGGDADFGGKFHSGTFVHVG